MRILNIVIAGAAIASLSACNFIQNLSTDSGFRTPSASGFYSSGIDITRSGREIDASGDGFAYAAGGKDGEGLKAISGLIPGTEVNFRPNTGSGTFTGRYELSQFSGIDINGDEIYGFASNVSGAISLNADFENDTLTGSAGNLTVNGTMDGRTLGGTVAYRGLSGPLRGLVGGDKTVGAFHGNNANLIYAGGFIADRE